MKSVCSPRRTSSTRSGGTEALGYQEAFEGSWVYDELNEVRNIKPAFKKWGLFGGVAYAGAAPCMNESRFAAIPRPVLAPSSGEEPASPRHRASGASMAWRSTP